MKKLVCESLYEFGIFEGGEPLALAVLGAPASGKSFTMSNITKSVKDARIADTISGGVNLTVDILRSEFQNKDSRTQLRAFAKAYYYMKAKAKEDASQYAGWFKDIIKLWQKLAQLIPALKITCDDKNLYFNGTLALNHLKTLNDLSFNADAVVQQLNSYQDYKRVVRYFQSAKQTKAIEKQFNVSYDESGDEPEKIVNTLNKLHKAGYVTDVFLIHPENVASNLIMNYFRVITGGDGGRDSSDAIVQAYLDIEKSKHLYQKNAEDDLKTTTKELQKPDLDPAIQDPIEKANVPDDQSRGDKPIDVFTEVTTMQPLEAWKYFGGKLKEKNKAYPLVLQALLKYRMYSIANLPQNAKQSLAQITRSINNKQAVSILKQAADSKQFVFQNGGITPQLVAQAQAVLK